MINLEIKDLEKKIFEKKSKKVSELLQYNKNLNFRSSRIYGISGPKGSGKSMLLRLLLRLNDVDKGTILLNGAPIQSLDLYEYRQYISAALYDNYFFMNSAEKEIAFTGIYYTDIPLANQKNRVSSLASLVQFPMEKLNLHPYKCSEEERLKIIIARTLFANSDILIFDETFDKIEKEQGKKILTNLQSICRQDEKLLIFTSAVPEYLEIADQIWKLKKF